MCCRNPERSICPFCHPHSVNGQRIVLENEHDWFLQQPQEVLLGSGIIVPKCHRETVFDLTETEWNTTYSLLKQAKRLPDAEHDPSGYNIGWNSGSVAGQ